MKILGIILIGLLLRLIALNQSFWLDEAAQVIESSRPIWQQFDLAADFHPPLYHLLLHFWLNFGRSEIWTRLLSVLAGLGSVWYIFRLASLKLKQKQSLLAAALLAVSAYHVYYSQEARPYMLFSFLSLASTYYLLKGKMLPYTLLLVASWYTAYFTPFLIFGQFLVVLPQKKILTKRFLYSACLSVLFFLPWLPELKRQLLTGFSGTFTGWQEIVSFDLKRNLGLTFARFALGRVNPDNNYVYIILIIPLFIAAVWSAVINFRKAKYLEFTVLFWVPFLSALILSVFLPVVAPQRLLFLIPFLYLSIVHNLYSFKAGKLLLLLIILVSLGSLSAYYYFPKYQRENWRSAVEYIESDSSKNKLALFAFPESFAPFLWYAIGVPSLGAAHSFQVDENDLALLRKNMSEDQKIFLFNYLQDLTDTFDILGKTLEESGYRQIKLANFEGVGFIRTYEN